MRYVDKKAIGGTIKHLNQNILVDFSVMLSPYIDEQRKIGHLLCLIDEQIDFQTEKYESLLKFKQACLQKMFPIKGNNPNIRVKGFSKQWKWVKVSSFCDISTGESNTQDQVSDGDYPFYIRSKNPVRSNRFLYDCEAVLTIGDGDIGKVFHYVNGKFDLHQRVYIMSNFTGVDAKFFYYAFSNSFYDRVISMSAKSTVDSVRRDMIADMLICLPEYDEQIWIRNYFSALDEKIATQDNVIESMKNIKSSLLQRMLL